MRSARGPPSAAPGASQLTVRAATWAVQTSFTADAGVGPAGTGCTAVVEESAHAVANTSAAAEKERTTARRVGIRGLRTVGFVEGTAGGESTTHPAPRKRLILPMNLPRKHLPVNALGRCARVACAPWVHLGFR